MHVHAWHMLYRRNSNTCRQSHQLTVSHEVFHHLILAKPSSMVERAPAIAICGRQHSSLLMVVLDLHMVWEWSVGLEYSCKAGINDSSKFLFSILVRVCYNKTRLWHSCKHGLCQCWPTASVSYQNPNHTHHSNIQYNTCLHKGTLATCCSYWYIIIYTCTCSTWTCTFSTCPLFTASIRLFCTLLGAVPASVSPPVELEERRVANDY